MLYGGIGLPGKPDLENIRKLDLLPVNCLRRMSRYGIAIDIPYLNDLTFCFESEMKELAKDIASYIPLDSLDAFIGKKDDEDGEDDKAIEINPDSAEQIADLLFNKLNVGQGKRLKRTGSGKRISTGKKQLELLREEHEVVAKILDYRERAKLVSTYTSALPKLAKFHPRGDCCPVCELPHDTDTWRVHTQFTTTRTSTGRLASKQPNLQNIPARSDLGALVRAGFIAPEGKRLVGRDLSQIELRDLAHCARAQSMIDVYRRDGDIHVFTACAVFGLDEAKYMQLLRTPEGELRLAQKQDLAYFKLHCRLPSKNLNFMTVYGSTAKGLQAQLALSGLYWDLDDCEGFIRKWFGIYPEVEVYMEEQHYRARRYGFVWDPFGRVRRVPETQSCHKWIREAGLRQAGNMPIQSVAAGQMKLVLAEADELLSMLLKEGVWCWPLLTVHDQLIVETREEDSEIVSDILEPVFDEVMGRPSSSAWRVAIKSDGEIMERWQK